MFTVNIHVLFESVQNIASDFSRPIVSKHAILQSKLKAEHPYKYKHTCIVPKDNELDIESEH